MEPIILASSSPRRQEILKMLKIPFRVIIPNIDETFSSIVELEQVPELLAREKVAAVIEILKGQEIPWVLGADTVILFEGKILFQGKPEDLATNKVVREKYLSNSFVLRKKDFQLIDEQKRAKEAEEDG